MRNTINFLLAVLFLTLPSLAMADESVELKKKIIMDQKKLVIMENMEFTEEEAKNFWPVYEKHQEELFQNGQQFGKIITSYASVYKDMKDDKALTLVDEFQKAQKKRLEVLNQYSGDLKKIMATRVLSLVGILICQ